MVKAVEDKHAVIPVRAYRMSGLYYRKDSIGSVGAEGTSIGRRVWSGDAA